MDSTELFSYYPASSHDVREAAEATRGRVADIRQVLSDVETDHRRAVGVVTGVISDSVREAPDDVVRRSTRLLRTAEYAAGCLAYFGWAIDCYNFDSAAPRSVNKLNLAYSTAISDAFGMDPLPDDATDVQVTRWSNRLERAADDLAGTLRAEKLRLDGQLDEHANEVRRMLGNGPNSEDLRTLWRRGALPPYAPVLFPNTRFDDLPISTEQQEALVEYLLAHPDELVDPDPAYAALLSGLPVDLRQRFDVGQLMARLRRRGPRSLYEEWLSRAVDRGLSLDEVLARIESEDVSEQSFDVLRGLERVEDADGRVYYLLDSPYNAREVVEAVELLNGGLPSESAERRDANDWSFDEDVPYILDAGGALIATPEGTLMGMAADEIIDEKEIFSQGGGTTWGEIFMLNGHPEDPGYNLRLMIESGDSPSCSSLRELLHHERVHSDQWARYGYWGMLKEYAAESIDPPDGVSFGSPFQVFPNVELFPEKAAPEENALEVEAGLEDGGYVCDGDPSPEED